MPDRCSKFKESKHSAPIFCRIISAQRGEEYSFVPWRGLPSGILSFSLRKSVGFFLESLGTCMLVGDLLVCMSSTLRHPI